MTEERLLFLIREAQGGNLWFFRYDGAVCFWYSPLEIKNEMVWNLESLLSRNWELRDPNVRITELKSEIAAIYSRVGASNAD